MRQGTMTNNTSSSHVDPHADHPRVKALEKSIAALREQLDGQDPETIIRRHIKLLHAYNETKDATQVLIGIYAQSTQKTITQVHTDLNLPLNE